MDTAALGSTLQEMNPRKKEKAGSTDEENVRRRRRRRRLSLPCDVAS